MVNKTFEDYYKIGQLFEAKYAKQVNGAYVEGYYNGDLHLVAKVDSLKVKLPHVFEGLPVKLEDDWRYWSQEKMFRETEYLVEGDCTYRLWARYSTESRERTFWDNKLIGGFIKWEQRGSGWTIQVGTLDKRPVCVSVSWEKLNGHIVCFYHGCSQVVDHEMIDKWLDKTFPKLGRKQTNEINFHNCLNDLGISHE